MQPRNLIAIIGMLVTATFVITLPSGCQNQTRPSDTNETPAIVNIICIFIRRPEAQGVPTGGWGVVIGPAEPYPPGIQEIFTPSEKMALGLSINQQLDQNITFSKYTFFNRKSGEETEIGVQDDLGPFEPGQVILIAWINPWPVPDEPGNYELRVYMGNEMVASAVFEVK